jgi:hypothetical protein
MRAVPHHQFIQAGGTRKMKAVKAGSNIKIAQALTCFGDDTFRSSPMKRLDNDRVTVRGWAADVTNDGAPLTVMVFAGGKHMLTMETSGRHVDVIQAPTPD